MIPPYEFQPGDEIVADYAEYSGLPVAEVVAAMNDFRALNRSEWEALPQTGWVEKAERFYGTSRHYVYDLLRGNPSRAVVLANLERFEPRIPDRLRTHPGKRFLDFGGGTGVICHYMADLGKEVTYLDLPGVVSSFAAWRFRKYGLPIEQRLSDPRRLVLEKDFDVIYSDAVFEHLIDPHGVARTLAAHLAPGGFFALLVDLEGENPEMPMHRDVDIHALHDVLAAAGLREEFGRGTFASGWSRA